jgi:hypothetical protein
MSSGRCTSCGGDLPRAASFCPRCGVGVLEVPVLGLLGDEQPRDDDDQPAPRVARTLVLLVAGIVAVVVVLSLMSGGDDAEPDGPEDATATTSRPTTTDQSDGSTTSTTAPLLFDGPGGPATAGAVLIHVVADDLAVVDLETGRQILVPGPDDDIQEVALGADALVTTTSTGAVHLLGLDDPAEWRRIDAIEPVGLVSARAPNVLLWTPDGQVAAVQPDGSVLQWDIPGAGGDAYDVVGFVGDEVVLNTVDGVFLIDLDGQARRVSRGRALATNGSDVLVLTCDDALRCAPSLIGADGQELRQFAPVPDGVTIESATLSPVGDQFLLGGWDTGIVEQGGSQLLRLVGDTWVTVGNQGAWTLGPAEWIGETGAVVWWSPESLAVEVVPADAESFSIATRSSGGTGTSGLVVEDDELPDAWLAELRG